MQTSTVRQAENAEERNCCKQEGQSVCLCRDRTQRKFGGTTGSGCEHHLVTVKRSAGGSAARRMSREAFCKRVGQSVSGKEKRLAARPVAFVGTDWSRWGAVPVAVQGEG